jgi:hypothetical protein
LCADDTPALYQKGAGSESIRAGRLI